LPSRRSTEAVLKEKNQEEMSRCEDKVKIEKHETREKIKKLERKKKEGRKETRLLPNPRREEIAT
jgi:hypothetical protein